MPRSIDPHPVINNPYPTDRVLIGRSIKELRARIDDPRVVIGRGTYGDPKFVLYSADARVEIGRYCSIAGNSIILGGGEHNHKRVTTFPFNWFDDIDPNASIKEASDREYSDTRSKGKTVIGSDVWIGYGALILSGVTIGSGAVIGAGAVVASNVPDYAIVVGNPARVLKLRFDTASIGRLLQLRWWEWNRAAVDQWRLQLLGDVEQFLSATEHVSNKELESYRTPDPQNDEVLIGVHNHIGRHRRWFGRISNFLPPALVSLIYKSKKIMNDQRAV